MNKPCARCNRVVYTMEQLKCLDQVWHKGCFSCDFCNTKLTMKNYKGYDKKPYCNAHYPKTTFTQVADNPEMRRVKANTKTISNIEYHKDLEEQKGKKISVESDPLTDKAMKNTKIQSNLVYHGHEKTREIENAHRPVEKNKQQQKVVKQIDNVPVPFTVTPPPAESTSVIHDEPVPTVEPTPPIEPIPPVEPTPTAEPTPPFEPTSTVEPTPIIEPISPVETPTINNGTSYDEHIETPLSDELDVPTPPENPAEPAEYNPMRDLQEAHQPAVGGYGHAGGYSQGTKYVALYDYTAADHDEVSFVEGDFIINPEIIDDGWMTGTVESTGRTGMLPSNYVEKV